MTFVGFLFTALNFVLLSYYDWNFTASTGNDGTTPIPNWVWLCAAFNIFAAYTLGECGFVSQRTYKSVCNVGIAVFQMELMVNRQDESAYPVH